MPKFLAANNVTISVEDREWRLFNGRGDDGSPIVEAQPDGLHYQPAFGTARRLSSDGRLPVQDIATVVVGWAVEDSSWHLGLLVTPDLAKRRGGRWCALARWDNFQGDQAERAGAALAARLDRPFRYVPPTTPAAPVEEPPARPSYSAYGEQETAGQYGASSSAYGAYDAAQFPTQPASPTEAGLPAAPAVPLAPPPLMPLPITVGEWIMQEDIQGLRWLHVRSWRTRTLLYSALSLGLGLVFISLSLGARLSPYAPVQPDYLPLVGLVIAALILALGVWNLITVLRSRAVVVDNIQKLLRVLRGNRQVEVQSPYEGIEYLMVSHVLNRREKAGAGSPYDNVLLETWLHAYSPRRGFILIAYSDHTEGRQRIGVDFQQRHELDLGKLDTPIHHAAVHMSEMMGKPVYVEER